MTLFVCYSGVVFRFHLAYLYHTMHKQHYTPKRLSFNASFIQTVFIAEICDNYPYQTITIYHSLKAFFALLLPITVHGRVSDIWRSYFSQVCQLDLFYLVAINNDNMQIALNICNAHYFTIKRKPFSASLYHGRGFHCLSSTIGKDSDLFRGKMITSTNLTKEFSTYP